MLCELSNTLSRALPFSNIPQYSFISSIVLYCAPIYFLMICSRIKKSLPGILRRRPFHAFHALYRFVHSFFRTCPVADSFQIRGWAQVPVAQ